MLAIVRSLEEWDAELRSLKEFEVYSDHKNLEYFMTVRKLTERQMRWALVLSRYNFRIVHVSGTENGRADALSRRDQDMPKNAQDDRLQERNAQLIKPEWISGGRMRAAANRPRIAPVTPGSPTEHVSLGLTQTENGTIGEPHPLLAN